MMSEELVTVENVNKKFCRSLKRSLWYGLKDLGSELIGASKENLQLRLDEFWALKDINLSLKRGETIGLIGPNGAGKTTLLRLMSGLIKPDHGTIKIRGRMQSLIALGAGFNPVLTGRENIYVNAAVFGISKTEIDRRFDEIVDFSGISEFIDTPVQSYSSGMTVRLGFSVAVHMEPDILLIDEVLAVGDISFRAKCYQKLGELKDKNIPWILVSHDMGTIKNQTDRTIFIEKGKIKFVGNPDDAISEYLYSLSQQNSNLKNAVINDSDSSEFGSKDVNIVNVAILDKYYKKQEYFRTGEPIVIQIDYNALIKIKNPAFGIAIYGLDGVTYTGTNTYQSGYEIDEIEGTGSIYYEMDALNLLSGIYRVRVDIHDKYMGLLDKRNDASYIHVKGGSFSPGIFFSPHNWHIKSEY